MLLGQSYLTYNRLERMATVENNFKPLQVDNEKEKWSEITIQFY